MSERHWIDCIFDFILDMWSLGYYAERLRCEEADEAAAYERVEQEMWAAELRQWDCAFKLATGMDYLPWEQRPTHAADSGYIDLQNAYIQRMVYGQSFYVPGYSQAVAAALQNQQQAPTPKDYLAQQAQRFPESFFSQQQLGALGGALGPLSNPLLDALRGHGPKKGPPSGSQ